MKKFLFFLTFVSSCFMAKADDMLLQIWQSDGLLMAINLNEEPKTTYVDGNLVITTTKTTITYPLEKVKKYTYVATDDVPIIEGMSTKISQDGESITFSGLKEGTEISVYSSAGKIVRKQKSSKEKTTTVSVSDLPSGAYIITVDSITYKITKL